MKDLRDSDKLVAALEDSRKKRVSEAWAATVTPRFDLMSEWIDIIELEQLGPTLARSDYDEYEGTIKDTVLADPSKLGRVIPAGWARETIMKLAKKFQDGWLNSKRREERLLRRREAVEGLMEWMRDEHNKTLDSLRELVSRLGLEIKTAEFQKAAMNVGERVQERDLSYWMTVVDEVLEEEPSTTFFRLRINWEYENDIFKARDTVKALKLIALTSPSKGRAEIASEYYVEEMAKVPSMVIRRDGPQLVEVLAEMRRMTEWEDLVALMCVKPRKVEEEEKEAPPTTTNMVDMATKLRAAEVAAPAGITGEKATLRFLAPKAKTDVVISALQWFSIEKLAEVKYSHFFEDPLGPLKTWTHTAAELCYKEPGYHFLVQRLCHRGNMAKDTSRDELAKALEIDLGSKVAMKTMGSCRDCKSNSPKTKIPLTKPRVMGYGGRERVSGEKDPSHSDSQSQQDVGHVCSTTVLTRSSTEAPLDHDERGPPKEGRGAGPNP